MVFISTTTTLQNLAPQSLELCFQFFDEKGIDTLYHKSENEIILDGKLMARILKYDGNMQKILSNQDIRFYSQLLQQIIKKTRFNGILKNCEYIAQQIDGEKNKNGTDHLMVKIIRKEAR